MSRPPSEVRAGRVLRRCPRLLVCRHHRCNTRVFISVVEPALRVLDGVELIPRDRKSPALAAYAHSEFEGLGFLIHRELGFAPYDPAVLRCLLKFKIHVAVPPSLLIR